MSATVNVCEASKGFLAEKNVSALLREMLKRACSTFSGRVPLFLRIAMFPLADSLHHQGRLDEAIAVFERALGSKLPLVLTSWDIFIGQQSMYLDLLLTLDRRDTLREDAGKWLKRIGDRPELAALMDVMLLRVEITEFEDPETIPRLADALTERHRQLDYRYSVYAVRGLVELAAAARRLDRSDEAGLLLESACELNLFNLGLLNMEIGIERAWQALEQGEVIKAARLAMEAEEAIRETGYLLRSDTVSALKDALSDCV
jgi:tetratricopeptide (TPR) repeat protein